MIFSYLRRKLPNIIPKMTDFLSRMYSNVQLIMPNNIPVLLIDKIPSHLQIIGIQF